MRALLAASILLLCVAALPAPAQATTTCYIDDVPCMVQCLQDDPCGVVNPRPTFVPCPAGEDGVGVDTGSRTTMVCRTPPQVPTITLGACPAGVGFVVVVNGNPTLPVCTDLA